MDPEDVLDFGEDDDGLDVISLGASDHDGRPVSNRSSSTIPDFTSSISRGASYVRPSSPSRARYLKSPHPQLNGSDRSRRHSSRAPNHPQAPQSGRRDHHVARSHRQTPNLDRPLRESSSRDSNRSGMARAPRVSLPSDRRKPGERASYMPPGRLQVLSTSSRSRDLANSSNDARRPPPILSTRITDHRDVGPKVDPLLNSSRLVPKPGQSDEKKDATKPVSEVTNEVKKPAQSSAIPSGEKLPEGWINRTSKAGKTYYVNVFTRTSQWARPTEPALDRPLRPAEQVVSKSLDTQPVPVETSENLTNQTQANVQKLDVIIPTVGPSVVSKSQTQGPDPPPPLRSLCNSENMKPSDDAVSHADPLSVRPIEQDRQPDITRSADNINRRSKLIESGSTQDSDHDMSIRPIPQEEPQSAISEPYPRGPRIHPDRRQEIVSASLNSPSSDSKIRAERRRGEFVRYAQQPDTFRPRANPRLRSISPDLRRVPSCRHLERHPREPVQLSGANDIPKAPGRTFPDARRSTRSPNDFNVKPDSSRYSKNVFLPYMSAKEHSDHRNADWWREPPDDSLNRSMVSQDRGPAHWPSRPTSSTHSPYHHRFPSRARSPSPPPRRLSSHQDFQRGPLQPDFRLTERSRPSASTRTLHEDRPPKPPKPPQSGDLMRRNTTSRNDSYRPSSSSFMITHELRFQDLRRGDACTSRDQGPRLIDHSEVEHRRSQATKSSTVPNLPKTSQVLAQPDLYRPPPRGVIVPRPSPRRASLPKYHPLVDLDEVMSKDEATARPLIEPLPAKTFNDLPSDTISQANPPRKTSDDLPSDTISQANPPKKTSDLPSDTISQANPPKKTSNDLPSDTISLANPPKKTSNDLSSDTISQANPPKETPNDLPSDTISQANPPKKTSNDLPSDTISRANPPKALHSSVLQGSANAQDFDSSKPAKNDSKPLTNAASQLPLLVASVADNKDEVVLSCKREETIDNDVKVSLDNVTTSPSRAVSPKKTIPLAKRLGPVAAYSSESDKLAPPSKRHRQNPVESSGAEKKSKALPKNSKVSFSLEKNLSSNADTNSQGPTESIQGPSVSEEKPTQLKSFPEMPPQFSQDKIISLRGRAGRPSGEVGTVEQPRPKLEDKSTIEHTRIGGGSLRDRIQDLNFPSVATRAHDSYQGRSSIEDGPLPSRHISERISGFRVPMGVSSSSNVNHRSPRHVSRQSDSGWSGMRARYP